MEIADMGFEPMYLRYERSEEPLLRNPRYKMWVNVLTLPVPPCRLRSINFALVYNA